MYDTIHNMTAADQKEPLQHIPRPGMVHFVLSRSYVMFLAAIVIGSIFHIAFPVKIFSGTGYSYFGFAMIIIGSLLICWAQSTSGHTQREMEKSGMRNFISGPYRYSRSPTHVGLTIMILGLSFVLNSLSIAVFTIAASIITKLVFLREEETLLEKRYGQPYRDYKKKVSSWI